MHNGSCVTKARERGGGQQKLFRQKNSGRLVPVTNERLLHAKGDRQHWWKIKEMDDGGTARYQVLISSHCLQAKASPHEAGTVSNAHLDG